MASCIPSTLHIVKPVFVITPGINVSFFSTSHSILLEISEVSVKEADSFLKTGAVRVQKINAKLHDGVCHHCKEVLEWRVKFNKYKPLSKPKKCVKCLQKTVKDSYHIICRPCACELEVCAKCGKEEEIVVPISKGPEKTEDETTGNCQRRINRRDESEESDDLDLDIDLNGMDNKNPDMLEENY
nr:uncharacterized protein C9orf85 homolog [Pelodiscus sinensis]|eukprot:XP_025034657.1 uncharacterized protein C9orf85 homolog [Pelodiscus sinensis]